VPQATAMAAKPMMMMVRMISSLRRIFSGAPAR
jgi:hypothetical protein